MKIWLKINGKWEKKNNKKTLEIDENIFFIENI